MQPVPPPPVPYATPTVRPGWADLPAELRMAIEERLGEPVRADQGAAGGFTGGVATVLETASGRVFVKAAPTTGQPHMADWYAREAAVTAALPADVPAPRPRWTMSAAGHAVLCLDAVDGHSPALPWQTDELTASLTAYARAAAALADPPAELTAVGLPRLADLARSDLSWWREVASGREPAPPLPPAARDRVSELADLEALLPEYADTGGVIHCDLRADNVLVDRAGSAWFCDWTWACHGPAWFDLAGLLVGGYASGLPVDEIFASHPVGRDVPPQALDATLAALSGYLLTGANPASAAPAALRAHRRWSGGTTLDWLIRRRDWR
ncbi:phosphotransferase [Plantactinospora sp. GCM10030261]|uniref:phosphotransferase n=1 Tax=Plantactinospora sp. GCM10030261 TaxID=3273420 RepID=UPI00361FE0AF